MIKFIIIAVVAFVVGAFGWAQVIGSLQNIGVSKRFLITLLIWLIILGAVAYTAIVFFDGLWPLCISYAATLLMVLSAGKIE